MTKTIAFPRISIVLLMLAVGSTAALAQSYQFAFEFGMGGSGDGQFSQPHNMAVDSSGNIFVPDFGNDRVQKLDSRGRFISEWGSSGSELGQFEGPVGIAVDSNDNVYVVELRNHRVQRFDNSGGSPLAWGTNGSGDGQFRSPSDIAVGPDDRVYVADRSNHRIQIFDSNGTFVDELGSAGSANGQFQLPTGIDVTPTGVLYVADQGNDRIQRFNSSGTLLTVFGTSGTGPGEFDNPSDVAVDADGDVIVVDKDNARIQVFGSDGEFFSQLGVPGTSAPGEFNQPRGATVDAHGKLYVADRDNHRIQVFVKSREFELTNQVSQQGDNYGQSMAVSGQLVAIGAPGRDGGEGTVDIYRREGNQLVFETEIFVPDGETAAEFGRSLALQNGILVVGAPADPLAKGNSLQAAIFQRLQGGNWQFKGALRSNNQTAGDRFGSAVAISGSMVAVGAPEDTSGRGATYLFRLNANEPFEEIAKIPPPGPGGKGMANQKFGAALAFQRGRLAVGGPGNGTDNTGLVALFNNVAANLTPLTMTGSNAAGDSFGDAVSLSGETMLVGSPGDDSEMGRTFFFGGNNFSAKVPITPANRPPGGRFGDSVALLLRRAIIGSPGATQAAKGLSTGVAFSFDVDDTGATSQDTDEPPANTCTGKIAKGCGDVVSYGEAAAIGDGMSIVGAPQAIDGEGTTFVTLETLKLFSDSYEGEKTVFE